MNGPDIICAVKPSPVVRTLLEVYYRSLGYGILYVCPKEDMLSWLADGTHLTPGAWYETMFQAEDYVMLERVKFVLVGTDSAAAWWNARGVASLTYKEVAQ